jgi:dCTP deaminase
MSQLSAQSIHSLCVLGRPGGRRHKYLNRDGDGNQIPMISPFLPEKVKINGKSAGLSSASYDARIAHDLVLGPHPGEIMREVLRQCGTSGTNEHMLDSWNILVTHVTGLPPCRALANTIEDFSIPTNVAGYVCDKSTYARLHVTLFNTLFDPGFIGNATLEIVNLSDQVVEIKAGDPICQFAFHWLDEATNRPYSGKYQNQPKKPVGAILK